MEGDRGNCVSQGCLEIDIRGGYSVNLLQKRIPYRENSLEFLSGFPENASHTRVLFHVATCPRCKGLQIIKSFLRERWGGEEPKQLESNKAKTMLGFTRDFQTVSQSLHLGCLFPEYLGLVLGSQQRRYWLYQTHSITETAQRLTTHRIPHDLSCRICN